MISSAWAPSLSFWSGLTPAEIGELTEEELAALYERIRELEAEEDSP